MCKRAWYQRCVGPLGKYKLRSRVPFTAFEYGMNPRGQTHEYHATPAPMPRPVPGQCRASIGLCAPHYRLAGISKDNSSNVKSCSWIVGFTSITPLICLV